MQASLGHQSETRRLSLAECMQLQVYNIMRALISFQCFCRNEIAGTCTLTLSLIMTVGTTMWTLKATPKHILASLGGNGSQEVYMYILSSTLFGLTSVLQSCYSSWSSTGAL